MSKSPEFVRVSSHETDIYTEDESASLKTCRPSPIQGDERFCKKAAVYAETLHQRHKVLGHKLEDGFKVHQTSAELLLWSINHMTKPSSLIQHCKVLKQELEVDLVAQKTLSENFEYTSGVFRLEDFFSLLHVLRELNHRNLQLISVKGIKVPCKRRNHAILLKEWEAHDEMMITEWERGFVLSYEEYLDNKIKGRHLYVNCSTSELNARVVRDKDAKLDYLGKKSAMIRQLQSSDRLTQAVSGCRNYAHFVSETRGLFDPRKLLAVQPSTSLLGYCKCLNLYETSSELPQFMLHHLGRCWFGVLRPHEHLLLQYLGINDIYTFANYKLVIWSQALKMPDDFETLSILARLLLPPENYCIWSKDYPWIGSRAN